MDHLAEHLKSREDAHEAVCVRCGACCGAYDGDPCAHLHKDKDGLFYCDSYEDRLGAQKTVSGERFNCVRIVDILRYSWKGDHLCAYKKKRRRT
jgi:hypothetical protein